MSLLETVENPFKPKAARIVRHYDLIKDHRFFQIRLIDMKKAMSFSYNPGQFIMLSIPGVGESPFSISSTPSRPGILELGVRRVGKLTESLFQRKDNDVVYIRGPYGNGFKLDKMVDRDLIIVAGGLGVIPLRSILYYVLDNRDQFKRIYFLYGARNPSEFLFKTEFFQLKDRDDIECFYTVDKPDTEWTQNVGVVTKLFNQIQLSLERRMKCGIGKCGHCAIEHLYTCMDGPVFTYWDTLHFRELI
jgi:sulfhydrogenase subunit gamma (sulfur reductase)